MNTTTDFEGALESYMAAIKADWHLKELRENSKMHAVFVVEAERGRNYIKIITSYTYNTEQGRGQRSVHSFIAVKDNTVKNQSQADRYAGRPAKIVELKKGDILKAATFKQPSVNFIRGNILQDRFGRSSPVTWTGIG